MSFAAPFAADSEQSSLIKIAAAAGATVYGFEMPYILWRKIVLALGGTVNGRESELALIAKAGVLWGADVNGAMFEQTILHKALRALGGDVTGRESIQRTLFEIASAVVTPTDPLADISFSMRLQTDRGLYKDTACTIPATVAGDIVKGWKDEISGSGLIAIQATTIKAPVLQFENGYPCLDWDGVDDEMRITSLIAAPYTVTAIAKLLDVGIYPMIVSTNCELRWHSNEGKAEINGVAVTSTQAASSLNSWIVSQGVLNALNEEHFQDGVSAGVSTADTPISAAGIQIGNRNGGSFFFKGRLTCVTFSATRPLHTAYASQIPPP